MLKTIIEIIRLIADCTVIGAVIFTYVQYRQYKKKEKADILAHFNERYSNDENIKAVVEYLMGEKQNDPTNYQKEMFLRFFEELQIFIEVKSLDPQLVYDTFAYYALEAYKKGTDFYSELNPNELNEELKGTWYRFGKFINEMKKYAKI